MDRRVVTVDILFIFTRGPAMGQKILVNNATNVVHAMEEVKKEIPATSVKSDTEDRVVMDVFEYNDFEVVHIRRQVDADGVHVGSSKVMAIRGELDVTTTFYLPR
jgi:hypothetical protein